MKSLVFECEVKEAVSKAGKPYKYVEPQEGRRFLVWKGHATGKRILFGVNLPDDVNTWVIDPNEERSK